MIARRRRGDKSPDSCHGREGTLSGGDLALQRGGATRPRRSRPDTLASGHPVPEARAKSRAATKVNAFDAVMASRTVIPGRVREGGGRVACVSTKTTATVEVWAGEAVATPDVGSGGTRGRKREGTDESPRGRRLLRRRKGRYQAGTRRSSPRCFPGSRRRPY